MQPDPTAQPATDASGTPDAGASTVSDANPFPWEAAGFGRSTAAVPEPPAPAGDSAQPPQAGASTPAGDTQAAAAPAPASEGTPATEPSKPEAAPAEAKDADKPGEPSRRQAAREADKAEIERLKAESATLSNQVQQAVKDALEAREAAAKAQADKDALEAGRRAAFEKRNDLRGPDDEFGRRTRIANRMFDPNYDGPKLTDAQATELAKWTYIRELEEPFTEAANQTAKTWVDEQIDGQRRTWTQQAVAVADAIGLDRAELGKHRDLGDLLKVTDANAVARIRAAEVAPLQEKVSQLETHIKGLETRVVHAQRTPEIGGMSDGGIAPGTGSGWDPSLPWDANFNRSTAATGAPQ